jgi:NAD(P)-dependent dehydrogenase (short-subunit alcohol dehydrogenase family)
VNRVALITGASRGLGRALATALAERGWILLIDARGGESLAEVAGQLAQRTTVRAIAGDLAHPGHRKDLAKAASGEGRLDLLVNNASVLGTSPLPSLAEYPLEDFREVLEVNLTSQLGLVQALLPLLRASRGRIIDITSDAAIEAYPGWGGYGAAKAGFEQLSRVLAAEEPGVRVYWADPGDMNTRMHQDAYPGEDISDRPPPEDSVPGLMRLIEDDLPSGRYRVKEFGQR